MIAILKSFGYQLYSLGIKCCLTTWLFLKNRCYSVVAWVYADELAYIQRRREANLKKLEDKDETSN
jgi:hypothetical protein